MSLRDAITNMCGDFVGEYRLTAIGSGCVYVEGVLRIISFTSREVTLRLKRSVLKITGEALRVEKLYCGDALIKGEVRIIERIAG